jgi:AraC family ethanolamine operon transcriptional activator
MDRALSVSRIGKVNEDLGDNPHRFALASSFDDVNRFAEAARGWRLDFRQMDPGRFHAELTHIVTPGVMLSRCVLGRKMEQQGELPEGFRTFAIPAGDSLDLRWRGKQVESDCIMLFPAERELKSVSAPGFDMFVISISEGVLMASAGRRGLASVEEMFPPTDLIACTRASRQVLVRLAARLTEAGTIRPDLLHSWSYRSELEGALVETLLDTIISGRAAAGHPTARSRTRALNLAMEMIHARAHEPVTVAELERLSGVSGRTLRYAFAEEFGISPKQYLQIYRLNRVQRQLQHSQGNATTVAGEAKAWGFWHMGQFSRDYRRMFGELPSETLARGR